MGGFFKKACDYFSYHVMLNSVAHSLGGFGLALLVQHYLKGEAFLPPLVGWACIAVSAAIHIMAMISSEKKGF